MCVWVNIKSSVYHSCKGLLLNTLWAEERQIDIEVVGHSQTTCVIQWWLSSLWGLFLQCKIDIQSLKRLFSKLFECDNSYFFNQRLRWTSYRLASIKKLICSTARVLKRVNVWWRKQTHPSTANSSEECQNLVLVTVFTVSKNVCFVSMCCCMFFVLLQCSYTQKRECQLLNIIAVFSIDFGNFFQ